MMTISRRYLSLSKPDKGKFKKMHYLVAPDAGNRTHYENISTIRTDGTYFLKIIKEHLCSTKGYLDDDIFDLAEKYLFEVQQEHAMLWEKYNPSEYPTNASIRHVSRRTDSWL